MQIVCCPTSQIRTLSHLVSKQIGHAKKSAGTETVSSSGSEGSSGLEGAGTGAGTGTGIGRKRMLGMDCIAWKTAARLEASKVGALETLVEDIGLLRDRLGEEAFRGEWRL